jgi:hypothetical protein
MRCLVIPGLVYSGETNAQAEQRENAMLEINRREAELERRNLLPMKAYRKWAEKRGLIQKTEGEI